MRKFVHIIFFAVIRDKFSLNAFYVYQFYLQILRPARILVEAHSEVLKYQGTIFRQDQRLVD